MQRCKSGKVQRWRQEETGGDSLAGVWLARGCAADLRPTAHIPLSRLANIPVPLLPPLFNALSRAADRSWRIAVSVSYHLPNPYSVLSSGSTQCRPYLPLFFALRKRVVLPLGVEPKSPASEARILSIEIRERLVIQTSGLQRSQILPERGYLAGFPAPDFAPPFASFKGSGSGSMRSGTATIRGTLRSGSGTMNNR